MPSRIALIGIVVENPEVTAKLNALLHEYADYIIGRMGLPFRKRNISIISVAVDAPEPVISALAGKLGMLPGLSAKTIYAKVSAEEEDVNPELKQLIDRLTAGGKLREAEYLQLIKERTSELDAYVFALARDVRQKILATVYFCVV